MPVMAQWTGQRAWCLRTALRLTIEQFAELLGVGVRTVAHWDAKRASAIPFPGMQEVLDAALDRATPDQLMRFQLLLRRPVPGADSTTDVDRRGPHRGSASSTGDEEFILGAAASRPKGDEDVDRRQMLVQLGMLGFATTLVSAEMVRQALAATLAGDELAVDIEEWDAIVDEYGRAIYVVPRDQLLRNLTADLSVLQHSLERVNDADRTDLARVTGQLCAFGAKLCSSAGEFRQADRWWRTARGLVDRSGDTDAQLWVRGEQVINGLYNETPVPVILDRAAEACAIAKDRACAGTASLHAGLAQTLAVAGRHDDAQATLWQAIDVVDRLPTEVTENEDSEFGWSEVHLRHTESYVWTWLGDTTRAYAAQETALRIYPKPLVRDRTKVLLHRATCMVRDGDIGGGLAYAAQALDDLPPMHHTSGVLQVGRFPLRFLPPQERARPEATELRDRVVFPHAGTSA